MATQTSLRAELAAAIRAVNAAFNRLPSDQAKSRVAIVADDVLDTALLDGDRDAALRAIEEWRDVQLAAIEAVPR